MTVQDTRNPHMKKSLLELRFLAYQAVLDGQVVMIGGTEGTVQPCTANANPVGVACNSVSAADIAGFLADDLGYESIEVIVMVVGVAPVLAGGLIAMNGWVISDAAGRVVAATGDGTDNMIGICYHATTADGDATHILVHRIPATD